MVDTRDDSARRDEEDTRRAVELGQLLTEVMQAKRRGRIDDPEVQSMIGYLRENGVQVDA